MNVNTLDNFTLKIYMVLIHYCRFEDCFNRMHYLGCYLCCLGHYLPVDVEGCAILYLYSTCHFRRNSLGIMISVVLYNLLLIFVLKQLF